MTTQIASRAPIGLRRLHNGTRKIQHWDSSSGRIWRECVEVKMTPDPSTCPSVDWVSCTLRVFAVSEAAEKTIRLAARNGQALRRDASTMASVWGCAILRPPSLAFHVRLVAVETKGARPPTRSRRRPRQIFSCRWTRPPRRPCPCSNGPIRCLPQRPLSRRPSCEPGEKVTIVKARGSVQTAARCESNCPRLSLPIDRGAGEAQLHHHAGSASMSLKPMQVGV